jgi:putative NIF3 family GTP cyclohydrolase 1 type 2
VALALDTIRAELDALLEAGETELLAPGGGPVARLAVALDPSAGPFDGFDAVVLHRARGFDAPAGLGVLGCHDPFDHRLGLAHNPFLHERLGLTEPRALAPKATLHTAPPDLAERVTALFGGREGIKHGTATALAAADLDLDLDEPPRAVLADALRPELVHAAVDAGAALYVTGMWRVPAAKAIDATGLTVLLVGHARQERWSLGLLAELLAGRLSTVEVVPLYERT